ncbi:hypothetical protein BC567DRAFT_18859 [Phyllosticta citribraziliensis]
MTSHISKTGWSCPPFSTTYRTLSASAASSPAVQARDGDLVLLGLGVARVEAVDGVAGGVGARANGLAAVVRGGRPLADALTGVLGASVLLVRACCLVWARVARGVVAAVTMVASGRGVGLAWVLGPAMGFGGGACTQLALEKSLGRVSLTIWRLGTGVWGDRSGRDGPGEGVDAVSCWSSISESNMPGKVELESLRAALGLLKLYTGRSKGRPRSTNSVGASVLTAEVLMTRGWASSSRSPRPRLGVVSLRSFPFPPLFDMVKEG